MAAGKTGQHIINAGSQYGTYVVRGTGTQYYVRTGDDLVFRGLHDGPHCSGVGHHADVAFPHSSPH